MSELVQHLVNTRGIRPDSARSVDRYLEYLSEYRPVVTPVDFQKAVVVGMLLDDVYRRYSADTLKRVESGCRAAGGVDALESLNARLKAENAERDAQRRQPLARRKSLLDRFLQRS